MRCKLVGWGDVQALTRELALRLAGDGYAPDILVAIGRGGWVPGRLLSDFLGNPNLTEPLQDVLMREALSRKAADSR